MSRWAACGGLTGLSLAILAGATGCSLLLDFDEPVEGGKAIDAGSDASDAEPATPDSAPLDASLAVNCAAFEPNETSGGATVITPMNYSAALCPDSDLDFYEFAMLADTNMTITLTFDNGDGSDLDIQLSDGADTPLVASAGTGNTEQIIRGPATADALPGGTYRIEVIAAAPVAKDYQLTLALQVQGP